MIAAFYVLAFGRGVYTAVFVVVGGELTAIDYSTARGQAAAVGQLGEIGGAAAVLFLITRWLGVPPALSTHLGSSCRCSCCATTFTSWLVSPEARVRKAGRKVGAGWH